jgi:hypothetical protein
MFLAGQERDDGFLGGALLFRDRLRVRVQRHRESSNAARPVRQRCSLRVRPCGTEAKIRNFFAQRGSKIDDRPALERGSIFSANANSP